MPAFKATWTGTEAALNGAGVLLTDVLFPPADAISLTKDDDTAADERTGWKLEAYFSDRPDEAALSTLLKDAGAGTPEIEELPDIDWVAHALEGLGVVDAGRFVLHGSHDADKIPKRATGSPSASTRTRPSAPAITRRPPAALNC